MSHRVEPADLADVASSYTPTPFLLYAGDDGTARVNHVTAAVEVDDGNAVVRCHGHGRGVARCVDRGSVLSLLWPAGSADQFSLIADGPGRFVDETLVVDVTGAVLHRPAPAPGADPGCSS